MDRNHLNNFERGSTKDHSCEIWSKSNQWFRRRCCLKIVNGRTDRRTTTTTDGEWSQYLTLSLRLRWAKNVYLTKTCFSHEQEHISQVFLAHLSQRLRMSYCDHLQCRRLSVRPHLWTTSPLKPLGQFSSNFMWSLLLKGDRKFVQMAMVRQSRWPPCPYMVKKLKKNLLQNQKHFKA